MLTADAEYWIRIARLWWRRWSKRIKKCSQGISHLGWLAWTMNSQYEVTARHQNDSRPHCPFTNICVKCECMMGIPWIHFTSCKAYSQLSCEECQRFQTPDPEVAGSVAIFIVFQEQRKTGRTNGEKPLEMLISVISVDQNLLSRLRKLWEKVLRIKHT